MQNLIKKFNCIKTESDVKKFIKSITPDYYGFYDGTNVDGETFTLFIGSNGYRVSTYQSNNWIRINEYILDENDEVYMSESYEKGDE